MEKELIEKLTSKFNFTYQTAWIYGSYALGMETSNSDIDVLFYDENITTPFQKKMTLDHIPVSLNFFGKKSICDFDDQLNSGLYFITRFLAPTLVICDKNKQSEWVENASFEHMLVWLDNFLNQKVNIWNLNEKILLSLIYLMKSKMNYCYLFYFSNWFKSSEFHKLWNMKLANIQGALQYGSTHPKSIKNKNIDNELLYWNQVLEFQQLSANFWKFSYSYRGYDECHIGLYHQKQQKKINAFEIKSIIESKKFLSDNSYPFRLIENLF